MNKNSPVIIIEDDEDDREFIREVFLKLNYPNKVLFFGDGQQALDYLLTTPELPFLILSDINMPKLNGFELIDKMRTDAALQLKCIPYLFFSTAADQKTVIKAYSLSAQGFFVKPSNMLEMEEVIRDITNYWQKCVAPNSFY